MNFKERGITLGDLLIILIIILTTTILVKSFNKDKKTTLDHSNQGKVSLIKTFYKTEKIISSKDIQTTLFSNKKREIKPIFVIIGLM